MKLIVILLCLIIFIILLSNIYIYYGIDTPKKEELIASTNSIPDMKKKLKLDSLNFLSIEGLYKSMGFNKRDNIYPQFTDHCFTGDYPTELTDRDEGILSSQLSLLSSN